MLVNGNRLCIRGNKHNSVKPIQTWSMVSKIEQLGWNRGLVKKMKQNNITQILRTFYICQEDKNFSTNSYIRFTYLLDSEDRVNI